MATTSTRGPMPQAQREECIKVVVRIRPLNEKEKQDGRLVIAQANENTGEIVVQQPFSSSSSSLAESSAATAAAATADNAGAAKSFTFDAVFGAESTQRQVYDVCAAPVVDSVLNGFNGTIFAYGQTGTGKSHTMEGGIIPNSFQHIFDKVAVSENQQFLVRASYLEIYNEEIRDLLSKDPGNKMDLKEHPDKGVYVKDLTSFVVKNAEEIDKVMQAGKRNRSTGATLMNQNSSRSHSIFTIIVECCSTNSTSDVASSNAAAATTKQQQQQQQQRIRVGKLNLVDLAGSERQSKTGATGERLKEATKINLSLSALGNVISALADGKAQHVPYRDSKLTRLLQDSLGGNTKTVMCANCGPADYNYDETISTLRYANRAKNIKNKPRVNEDPKDTMLREFQEEIRRLKEQLAAQDHNNNNNNKLGDGGNNLLDGRAQGKDDGSSSSSGGGGLGSMKKSAADKLVEKVVVRVDASQDQLREMAAKAEKEKEELKSQAKRDMDALQSKSGEEKEALQQRLSKEAEDRRLLEEKLKAMEAKLIQGGGAGGEAGVSSQEQQQQQQQQLALLEKTKVDQRRLAQELAIKEETNLVLEDNYSSLQEEVDAKTKKLKKLWSKYQGATREVRDLQVEFQREREDLLDTIRQLTRQLKLKDVVLQNFVPPEEATKIEKRAVWNEEKDTWTIARLCNNNKNNNNKNAAVDGGSDDSSSHLLVALLQQQQQQQQQPQYLRLVSSPGLRRPETNHARSRRTYDPDPRFRSDNILDLELDMGLGDGGELQHYLGPDTVCQVGKILDIPLDGGGGGEEEQQRVLFSDLESNLIPSPYMKYAYHHQSQDALIGHEEEGEQQPRGKGKGSGQKQEQEQEHDDEEEEEEEDEEEDFFPAARGLMQGPGRGGRR